MMTSTNKPFIIVLCCDL